MKCVAAFFMIIAANYASASSISVAPATAAPGEPVTISVDGGQSSGDWVQIVSKGRPESFVDNGWVYLNGMQTKPTTAIGTVSIQLRAPGIPGEYDTRLYLNGSRIVAGSAPLQVAAKPQQCPAQCPAGPKGDTGEPGSPLCKPTDILGSACPSKGASCLQIDHPETGPTVAVRVCDDLTLKWIPYP